MEGFNILRTHFFNIKIMDVCSKIWKVHNNFKITVFFEHTHGREQRIWPLVEFVKIYFFEAKDMELIKSEFNICSDVMLSKFLSV